jgi:hypothetical protein
MLDDFANLGEEFDRARGTSAPNTSPIWVDADDWDEATIPQRPWVAPGYALRGAVTLLTGPPGAMKSSMALAWACAVVLGREYGRFRPSEPAVVLVYNVEDDGVEQRRRLSAVLRQFGAKPSDLVRKLHRAWPSGIGTLLDRDDTGTVRFTPAMTQLTSLIEVVRPSILIVDPLAELHNAAENDNTALRAVIAKFREIAVTYEMAVVVLHHTRKGASQAAGDPDAARGASAIIGAVRVALTLTPMSVEDAANFGMPAEAEARANYIRMDNAKSNYSPIGAAEWFEKVAYLLDNGETVPAAVPWTPPTAKIASLNDLLALVSAIKRGTPEGEPWSPKLSKEPRSVRALFERHGFHGREPQRKALEDLQTHHGMTTVYFHYADRRGKAQGLRVGSLPQANWADDIAPEAGGE